MRTIFNLTVVAFAILVSSLTFQNDPKEAGDYRCLIQLKNYQGENAYVIVSIVDDKGKHQKTLRVLGDDKEWYPDITEWYKHREEVKHRPNVDGVTGASITSGGRSVVAFKVEEKYLNKGYSLRFESAVEDRPYYAEDIVVKLTSANLATGKFEGKTGYIRQIRLIPVNK